MIYKRHIFMVIYSIYKHKEMPPFHTQWKEDLEDSKE